MLSSEYEARERYERDRISLYASGRRDGKNEGFTDAVISFIQTLQNDNASKRKFYV